MSAVQVSPVRCAQRALLQLIGTESRLYVVNTHLHHELDSASAELRAAQTSKICEWMDGWRRSAGHCVFLGDFNAPPWEAAYSTLQAFGLISAYAATHDGKEPDKTFPTGFPSRLA